MGGYVHVLVESFVPGHHDPGARARARDDRRRGHRVPPRVPHRAAASTATSQIFPDARAFVGGGAAKPPALHYEVKDELGGVGIVSGYGLTEVPILAMAGIHDADQKLADTEGRVGPASR